jgi:hypothetical protein
MLKRKGRRGAGLEEDLEYWRGRGEQGWRKILKDAEEEGEEGSRGVGQEEGRCWRGRGAGLEEDIRCWRGVGEECGERNDSGGIVRRI